MTFHRLVPCFAALALASTASSTDLVPAPQSIEPIDSPSTAADANTDDRHRFTAVVEAADAALRTAGLNGVQLGGQPNDATYLVSIDLDPSLAPEAYRLASSERSATLTASTAQGVAHGIATLMQMIALAEGGHLQRVRIRDEPDHGYRSLMIDLGRNPHSLALLKETVDLCWFYKVQSIHLHLTDDQRFAFPSRAFPKLWTAAGGITWDGFTELVEYAHVRGVTLIPELEVPGHSALLCRTYPEVFGEDSTEVAKLASSRRAIEMLLDEMIELFPNSPSIHIGGDEAFGVPEDLQRDLINDLHAHLKSRGKQTLVWEGPGLGRGDNKVHEEVIHLNWRTINFPADQMLRAGYRVVNASWDPLYVVDHYPRNNFTLASPEHVYRTLNVRRFKHFNPSIQTFAEPIVVQPSDRLLGFCLPWWEGREEHFLPLVTPRLIPMAAVAWNRDAESDYETFAKRVERTEAIRRRLFYPVTIEASPLAIETDGVFHRQTTVRLATHSAGTIRYTLDGSEPTLASPAYDKPFVLDKTANVRAALFDDRGEAAIHGSRRKLIRVDPIDNLALGKPVTASASSGPPFSLARLTDGGVGELDYYLGYPTVPNPIEITIDLGEPTQMNQIVVHAYTSGRSYESYEVRVSRDGETYRRVGERLGRPSEFTSSVTHDFPPTKARYVRIVTHGNQGQVFDSFSRLTEVQAFNRPRSSPPR